MNFSSLVEVHSEDRICPFDGKRDLLFILDIYQMPVAPKRELT